MGGSKAQQPGISKEQENRSKSLFDTWNPLQTSLAGQGNQLVQTGGISQMIPMLTTLLNSARSGFSKSMTSLNDSLGRSRLAGTPFGQRLKSDQQMAGEQQVASTIPQFYQWFLPQVMNAMTGNTATGMQGMSAVTGAETQRVNNNANNVTQQNLQMMRSGTEMMTKMMPTTSFGFTGSI